MIQKIREAMRRAGFQDAPNDPRARLADFGFDSLMVVLTVSELEREFAMKIPAASLEERTFESLTEIEAFLKKLGAR